MNLLTSSVNIRQHGLLLHRNGLLQSLEQFHVFLLRHRFGFPFILLL